MKLDFPKFVKIVAVDVGYRDDIYKTINSDGTIIYAIEAKMTEVLSQALHFDYKIEHPKDNLYGTYTGDGNWSGLIGVLQRGESDLIVDELTITTERQEVIDFSYPYHEEAITFVTAKPVPMQKSIVIFYPFSYIVWILLFISLMIFCLLVGMHNRKKSKINIFFILFGYILQQSFPGKFRKLSARPLFYTWIIGVMFLSYSYKATLFSYASFPIMTGVRNIAELSENIKKGSHICATYKSSYLIEAFMSSQYDNVRTCGKSLLENSFSYLDAHHIIENSSKVVAYVSPRSYLSRYERKYFLSKDTFYLSSRAVGVRLGFCCKRALDEVILRIWETGIYDKMLRERKMSYLLKDNWTEVESEHPLKLKDTVGIFTILFLGHALAGIIFIFEIIFGRLVKGTVTK